MFTGIIERTVRILSVADGPGFRRLSMPNPWNDVKPGQSIAINGCCLTAAEISADNISFDVITETLGKTNLGSLFPNEQVNVERSLRVGDRIDGHFVQGHVDGVARLIDVLPSAGEWRLVIESPPHLARFLVSKGSVSIDGVSLTIASLDQQKFEVALIPTTLQITTLGNKTPGYYFNIEADMFSKTIVGFLEKYQK